MTTSTTFDGSLSRLHTLASPSYRSSNNIKQQATSSTSSNRSARASFSSKKHRPSITMSNIQSILVLNLISVRPAELSTGGTVHSASGTIVPAVRRSARSHLLLGPLFCSTKNERHSLSDSADCDSPRRGFSNSTHSLCINDFILFLMARIIWNGECCRKQ